MLQILFSVVLVAAAVAADDCMPPKPEDLKGKMAPWKCCDIEKFYPEKMASASMACKKKHPLPKPSGPSTGSPDPAVKKVLACAAECMYKEAGMLKDSKPDKAASLKVFVSATGDNKELVKVTNAAMDKCYETYMSEVDTSLECKSGALELDNCVDREVFLNCPKDNWTDKPGCEDIKTILTKCPKMHILSMTPGLTE